VCQLRSTSPVFLYIGVFDVNVRDNKVRQVSRCRANSDQTSQSRPEPGFGLSNFQGESLQTVQVVASRLVFLHIGVFDINVRDNKVRQVGTTSKVLRTLT